MPLEFALSDEQFLTHAQVDPRAGGLVTFVGRVRGHNWGKDVAHLDYEAYETLAKRMFGELEQKARKQFGLLHIDACHRLGRVLVGQGAVIIQAQAAHRHEAFLGARFLIDELKKHLPIWKKEVYCDGSFSFDGSHCHCISDSAVLDEIMAPARRALSARNVRNEAIAQKRVAIVGAGGLGCPLAINLSALGVMLTLIDGDKVERVNLARQYGFRVRDQGAHKVDVLSQFIGERGFAAPQTVSTFVSATDAVALFRQADIVVDATDDPITKIMLRHVAYAEKVSLVSASVHQHDGEVQVYDPNHEGCLLCFSASDVAKVEGCSQNGVLTHICQLVAAVACDRVLAMLSGYAQAGHEITLVDPAAGLRRLRITRDPSCANCGVKRVTKKLVPLLRRAP